MKMYCSEEEGQKDRRVHNTRIVDQKNQNKEEEKKDRQTVTLNIRDSEKLEEESQAHEQT